MKKFLIVAMAVLLVFAASISAQDKEAGMTAKGFKFGMNMANVSGSDADFLAAAIGEDLDVTIGSTKSLMGFAFGGFFTYTFSPGVALQPEFLYSMKGFTVPVEGIDVDFKIDYLEIPILLKYSFGTSTTKPFLVAGPSLAFLMSSKVEVMGVSVDIKDAWKSLDMGLAIGGGVGFPMGSGSLSVEGRYTVGMSKIVDTGDLDVDIDMKNTNLSFMLGYGF